MARRGISLEDFDQMHVEDGRLYWDGQAVITEKRWGTVERRIAIAGLAIAGIGVAATVVQAWAAITPAQSRSTNFQTCLERMDDVVSPDTIELKLQTLSVCMDAG